MISIKQVDLSVLKTEKKIKNKKSKIIIAVLVIILSLLIYVFGCFTGYLNSYNKFKGVEPVVQELQVKKDLKVKKVNISFVDDNSSVFYFNKEFSAQTTTIPLNTPLATFGDNNTYIYFSHNNEGSEYSFVVTNGVVTKIVAKYLYENYTFMLETNISDGYLYCIYYNDISLINNINNNQFNLVSFDILLNERNYVSTFEGQLYVGYNVDNFQSGYDKGLNDGINKGQNNVIDNPNTFGLYDKTQYDTNYNNGYTNGVNSVTPDLASKGFFVMIGSILNAPYNILNGMLNFSLFGINLFALFSFVFTLMLIAFVVKLFLK